MEDNGDLSSYSVSRRPKRAGLTAARIPSAPAHDDDDVGRWVSYNSTHIHS